MSAGLVARRVREYCSEHGLTHTRFARLAGLKPATLDGAMRIGRAKNRTLDAAVAFMDAHPAGPEGAGADDASGGGQHYGSAAVTRAQERSPAPARPAIDAAEVAKRERAPARRMAPEYRARLRDGSRAERAATICVETPAELIATVQRAWPDQWRRVVELARASGTLPGAMLSRVIAAGLEAEA